MAHEYLMVFPSEGEFSVDVKFDGNAHFVSQKRASIGNLIELLQLIDASEKPVMTFDEHPGLIKTITIDVKHNHVSLSVNLLDDL